MTPPAPAAASFAEVVRDVFDGIESWAGGLSGLDFLLLVVVAAAVYWISSTVRALTRIGPLVVNPIEIDPVEAGKSDVDKADSLALTGLLREQLGKSGLSPPPEVPAGSPQTNLIDAVEASGDPRAPWAAKLLKLVPEPPRPPEFTLHATLFTSKPNGPEAQPTYCLRYWLRPKVSGLARLETVECGTYEEAIRRTAADVFRAISEEAVHVFPQWSKWQSHTAFLSYVDGLSARVRSHDHAALWHFGAAADAEPRNLLPRLQIANLLEKQAAHMTNHTWAVGSAEGADLIAALEQARVLRLYLDIAVDAPSLVAARYRASVVAATLARACADPHLNDAECEVIRQVAGLPSGSKPLSAELHSLSDKESDAALSLLKPLHVILDKRRLRHRYEPRGLERRELRGTIAIARHARKVRKLSTSARFQRARVMRRRVAVRGAKLILGRASAGWNTHYNAGCFYAVLYDRQAAMVAARGGQAAEARDHHKAGTLWRRAFEELNLAVEKAGPELSGDWLARCDPDLERLRASDDPQWQLLVQRHTGVRDRARPQLPEPAWGEPNRRRNEWTFAAVVFSLPPVVAWTVFDAVWWHGVLIAIPAIAMLGGTAFVAREAWQANKQAQRARGAYKQLALDIDAASRRPT